MDRVVREYHDGGTRMMDPLSILGLIVDLYTQVRAEQARAEQAEAELLRLSDANSNQGSV